MSKAAETKSVASPAAKSRTPFFNKGEGSALSLLPDTESSFFGSEKSSVPVQAKLSVGEPGDPFEKEADAVADKVVQKSGEPDTVQAAPETRANTISSTSLLSVQAKCSACEQEEVQKKGEEDVEETIPELQRSPLAEALPAPLPPGDDGNNNSPAHKAQAKVQLKQTGLAEEEKEIQKKPVFESSKENELQRKCAACSEEEEQVQKQEIPGKEEETKKLQAKPVLGTADAFADTAPLAALAIPSTSFLQTKCAACAAEEENQIQKEELPGAEEDKIQKKLSVGRPDDPYEQEADAVADKVVQKLSNPEAIQEKQTGPVATVSRMIQAKCNNCETGCAVEAVQTKPIFESNGEPEVQRRCRECEEGDRVFLKTISNIQRSGKDIASANGSRESVIAAAKTMLGKIEAKHDDGGGKRVGAKYLLEIFHLAAPGVWDDSTIETAGAQLPSWCGIFSVWAHKKAGKDIGNWQMGKGVSAFGKLTQTASPQPGDIGYIDQPFQHHCIVVKTDGGNVHTIDGNSGLFSEVKENIRPLSAFTGFFTAFGSGSSVQRKEETNEPLQAKEETGNQTASSSVEERLSASKSGGSPLAEPVRDKMESSIGADFSSVKIHTDNTSVQLSKDLNAQAFTHGSDIYFNSGKFDANSASGQHLLAHELTHTVQQGAAIQKKEIPQIQKDGGNDPVQEAAGKVYDALSGWTDSDDSYIIWNQFDSTSKDTTDKIVSAVAAKAEISIQEVYEWMYSDMVTSDWNNLFGHFVTVRAYRTDYLIAKQVYSYLSGYTSDSNSSSILSIYTGSTPITGELLGSSLVQLEAVTAYAKNEAAKYLFGDLTNLDAHKLSMHFFDSANIYATSYASYWIATKVEDLLAGFTGMDDSEAIVKNFSRVPEAFRSVVLFELEKICQARWQQSAAKAMMEDMWQSDYEELRTLMPDLLPVYNIERAWYEWPWELLMDGFDFLSSLIQYGVCGLVGVIWGIVTVITDIIVAIVDIVVAIKDILGLVVYFISGEKFCKENYDNVMGFFKSMGMMWDAPGEAISKMWEEVKLEGQLIEGPFAACKRSIFWVSRITNLIVNIALILWAGFGAVKLALKGLEAIVTLARAGELIAALKKLPMALWEAVKKLPGGAAKSISTATSKIVNMILHPLETLAKARSVLTTIRMAAEDQKFFEFLRKQMGRAIDKESTFWKERRDFWKKGAEKIEQGAIDTEKKLVGAVESAVDEPGKSEKIIGEAETQANASKSQADDLMDDVNGTKGGEKPGQPGEKPKEPVKPVPTEPVPLNDRFPEPWREGKPTRPPRLKNAVDKMQAMGYSEDTIANVVNNAFKHPDMSGDDFFSALNNIVLKNPESPLVGGRANTDKLVNALAGEKDFLTARFLISRTVVNQSIAELMRVFTLEDIGALRVRFAAISDAQFVRDMNGILPRVNGSREEILALLKEAGDPGLENFNAALDRLGQAKYTPAEIRESFAFGQKLAKAMSGGADDIAKVIWEDPNLEKLPDGRYKVSGAHTGEKAGDQASRFIRARANKIAEQILKGGTELDAVNWEMVKNAILNTDLPTIVKNDIIGELFASAKVLAGRRMGYEVIREVTLEILSEAGKPTGKKARLDAVFKKGKEMLYKEFKSSATAKETANQEIAYKLLEDGKASQLRPTGPNAETAFGGPDMPDFKSIKVDIERPPTK